MKHRLFVIKMLCVLMTLIITIQPSAGNIETVEELLFFMKKTRIFSEFNEENHSALVLRYQKNQTEDTSPIDIYTTPAILEIKNFEAQTRVVTSLDGKSSKDVLIFRLHYPFLTLYAKDLLNLSKFDNNSEYYKSLSEAFNALAAMKLLNYDLYREKNPHMLQNHRNTVQSFLAKHQPMH